ncbi:MAG: hypothetical protein ACRDSR_07220 [Pseudonocardiaceae bacterium]
MTVSRTIQTELGYLFRELLSSVPSLRASTEQRSDFQLLKSEFYEALAATNPAISAQCMDIANAAKREAHAIALDY